MILLDPGGLDSRNVAHADMARGQYLALSKVDIIVVVIIIIICAWSTNA